MDTGIITRRMSADEFILWSLDQPEGKRFELVAGDIVGMASERAIHARVKTLIHRRMTDAIESAGLACEAFADGMAIRVDDDHVFEPDAAVRCGTPLDDDATIYDDPVIVVEVLSPSSRTVDTTIKRAAYFGLPSLHHYLIVHAQDRTVIHHQRLPDGTIQTRPVASGPIALAPPGITLDIATFFPAQPSR